ncbi:MAG: 30S ribosomal protein S6 [FCB group bacterium]|nr:30S ribosomal protein S6 [FCB group bacterium]
MKYYETLYIVNPNFEQDRLDHVMRGVTKAVEREKVNIINHRIWGKKRLAYPIQKHKYGTYILLQFEADDVSFLTEFDQFLKLEKAIIRHQTIRLEERPEVYAEEAAPESVKEKTTVDPETEETVAETKPEAETNESTTETAPEENREDQKEAVETVTEEQES